MVAMPQMDPLYPRPTLLLLPTTRREPVALLPAWTQTALNTFYWEALVECEDYKPGPVLTDEEIDDLLWREWVDDRAAIRELMYF